MIDMETIADLPIFEREAKLREICSETKVPLKSLRIEIDKILKAREAKKRQSASLSERDFIDNMVKDAQTGKIGDLELFYDYATTKYIYNRYETRIDEDTGKDEEVKVVDFLQRDAVKQMIIDRGKAEIVSIVDNDIVNVVCKWLPSYIKGYNPHLPPVYGKKVPIKNMCILPEHILFSPAKKIGKTELFAELEKLPGISLLLSNLFTKNEYLYYFLNWMSFIVQTKRKTRNAIVLLGPQGTGKGVLFENIIQWFFGQDNCLVATNQDIRSSFNNIFDNRLFVCFNEIKGDFRDGNTIYEQLKGYITERDFQVNMKHITHYRTENHFNCIFFSNHEIPLQIEGSDRRYSVFKTSDLPLKQITNVDELIQKIKFERENFLKILLSYEYDKDFAVGLFDTEQKQKIVEQSNTKSDIIKSKLSARDVEYFETRIGEYIEGKEKTYSLKELNINKEGKPEPTYYRHTNEAMAEEFIENVKHGVFSNEVLTWFYSLYVNEGDSMNKIVKFWGLIFDESYQLGTERVRCRLFNTAETAVVWGKNYRKVGKRFVDVSFDTPSTEEIPF